MALQEQETRVCTRCENEKPLDQYRTKFRSNGKPYLSWWCEPCELQYQRDWRKKNRSKQNEYKKEWRKKSLQDPVYSEILLDAERKARQRWRSENLLRSRAIDLKSYYKNRDQRSKNRKLQKLKDQRFSVPAEPFRYWLNEKCDKLGKSDVAMTIGVTPRRLDAILTGSYTKHGKTYQVKNIRFDTVDRYMIALGHHPWEIYDMDNL